MAGSANEERPEGQSPRKFYTVEDAVKGGQGRAKAKFDETIEMAFNLRHRPEASDRIRGASFRCRTVPGKSVRVAVFRQGREGGSPPRRPVRDIVVR